MLRDEGGIVVRRGVTNLKGRRWGYDCIFYSFLPYVLHTYRPIIGMSSPQQVAFQLLGFTICFLPEIRCSGKQYGGLPEPFLFNNRGFLGLALNEGLSFSGGSELVGAVKFGVMGGLNVNFHLLKIILVMAAAHIKIDYKSINCTPESTATDTQASMGGYY